MVILATAAAATGFNASLKAGSTNFSSATLQLKSTTGSNSCYSTGSGSGGTVSSNSGTCTSGSPVPSGALSSASSSSATTTLTSVGKTNASAATVSSASCGVAQVADSTTSTQWSGTGPDTALPLGGVTYQASGPLGSQAITTDGSTGWAETTVQYTDPESFTILAWFKTSSATGSIVGFENNQTAPTSAGNYDRMLWIDPSGHLVWAVYNGANDMLTSTSTYNNGAWHFVAASVGSSGQKLYVDGALAGSSSNTSAQTGYSGWWSIGLTGVLNGGWTDTPSSAYFNGSIAQLAVIPSQLTSTQVSNLYADNTLSTYTAAVNALSAANYWALNDSGLVQYLGSIPGGTASTTLVDSSGNGNTGTAEGGVTLGAAGPTTLGGNAISLDGSTGWVQTTNSYSDPEGYSAVAWFKTSTTTGGGIMGFTNVQGNGSYANRDRQIWIDNSGHLVFGVYNPSYEEVNSTQTTSKTYNDSSWHMVVAEIGSSGMQLWADGTEVASNGSVTSAQSYTGYWHLGWVSVSGSWPDAPTNEYFSGSLSEMAIIPTQLTGGSSGTQIYALYHETSASAFASYVQGLSPTSDWPLQDAATSPVCGTTEITVQTTVGSTNTCIYPAASGACAAPSSAYLVTGLVTRPITAPSGTAVTVKITMELSAASPAGTLGLHELADLSFGTTKSSTQWSAQISYPSAWSQL